MAATGWSLVGGPELIHNGILHSRKKEGTPPFWDSMDGTAEYYVK